MKERRYFALYDNGDRYGCEFYFYSCHRAGSKANEQDFKNQLRSAKGYSYARSCQLISAYLEDD